MNVRKNATTVGKDRDNHNGMVKTAHVNKPGNISNSRLVGFEDVNNAIIFGC